MSQDVSGVYDTSDTDLRHELLPKRPFQTLALSCSTLIMLALSGIHKHEPQLQFQISSTADRNPEKRMYIMLENLR